MDPLTAIRFENLVSYLFWVAGALQFFVLLWFILQARAVPKHRLTPDLFRLARGQRADSWLAGATIWAVILSKGCPVRTALFGVGALVLAWLATRTTKRLRVLLQST